MISNSSPRQLNLPAVDLQILADLVSASADLTMVVDGNDVVGDLSHNLQDLPASRISSWRGQRIDRVVNRSSLSALKTMLLSARDGKPTNGYEIGHRLDDGRDLPVKYSAYHVGGDGQVVLVGRDLRPTVALQSRLLANRQSLDQNRRRQRRSETHYRLLFETISDAIVIVDAEAGKIREANPRAAALLDSTPAGLSGKTLTSAFEKPRRTAVKAMVARVAATGTPATLAIEATGDKGGLSLYAELFRADDLKLILLRISAPDADGDPDTVLDVGLSDLVRKASEAVVLTDEEGRLDWVNESFLVLADLPLAAQAVGRPLDAFLRWHGIEQDGVLDKVRRHGRVPMVSGAVRRADGRSTEIEASVVMRSGPPRPGYAFVMRIRPDDDRSAGQALGDAARLADMVGRVPMKDLVRDTTDLIERMCIEAALKLAGNNRASAARALGLSRQALYLKLRRYGIADGD